MQYTIKELIQTLQEYDETLQVAVFNHASQIHNTSLIMDIGYKKEEFTKPCYPEGALDQTFLSLRSIE